MTTGRLAVNEIRALRDELIALRRDGYIIAMRLMQSDLSLDDAERAALDAFITKENMRAASARGS